MDVKNSLLYLNTLNLSKTGRSNTVAQNQAQQEQAQQGQLNTQSKDLVKISQDGEQQTQNFQRGSRLVAEEIQETDRGIRRTQEFANNEGRQFTRIEEINNGEDRTTRTVIQQNDSGNTTLLENVFDRQEDGSFRLTQRFTDETGDTQTNIQFGVQPPNSDVALGRISNETQSGSNPFDSNASRGSTLNISA